MLDWLAVWGVTSAVGLVFKPILEDLAKDASKDWAKDLMKDSLKHVLRLPSKEPVDIAAGKALKEFLQLVQDELEDADVSEAELKQFIKPLKQFIKDKSVKEILGSAFKDDCQVLDAATLAKTWNQLNLLSLPDEFEWERVAKRYLKKVKALIRESDELRALLDSQNLEGIEQNTKELAGIAPEFDLRRYQEGIRERYANLNLDSLDTSVYDYREKLKVWQVFIAQNVRECQEYSPQVYEIPKEHQKRLRESNELEAEFDPEEWERYKQVYYQQPVRSVLDVVNEMQSDRLPPQPPLVRGENLDPPQPPLKRGEKDVLFLPVITGKENPSPSPVPPLSKGGLGGVNAGCNKIVILGDPGSGKSTLLQYIALNWARTPLNNVISQPIPLLIELRIYSRDRNSGQCKDFLEFFHKGSVICRLNQHQLHEQLKAGKVLVMFDGLDEVFDPAQREEVITDIHRFTNDYPNVRVIVTSRIIGYKAQRLRDAEFRHFMLQDLESEQIQDFIYRWHELTFTDEADKVRKRERLQQAIKTSSAIGELAGNPLLLTMMAILNRNQELPRDRPELYNQASRVLLHQWDVEQKLLENPRIDSVTIDYKDKQAILRQVAYHMQAADKGLTGNLIRGEDLEKILTGYLKSIEVSEARTVARLLIEQLRSRNFILCFLGADSYGFVHRTFLEYFCACEFVERFGKRGLEGGLTLEELKTEVFGKNWQDESWHEVLRLITGMIDTSFASEMIDYLMDIKGRKKRFINIFLASKCLSEVRNRSVISTTSTKLLSHLKEKLINYRPIEEIEAIYQTSEATFRPNLEILDDDRRLNRYTKLKRGFNTQVVSEIATSWRDEPDTLVWLKTCAQSNKDRDLRWVALEELVKGWKDDPETLSFLKTRVQSDVDEVIRDTALQELARVWKDDPDTLDILKNRAYQDECWFVRKTALEQLARGWKDEPDMFEFLHNRAVNDEADNCRETALKAIIQEYLEHPQALPLVFDRSVNDPDVTLRAWLVETLAWGMENSPEMFDFLCDCATNDPYEGEGSFDFVTHPRRVAIKAIIEQYLDYPQTLSLLRDRAEHDSDGVVRLLAVQVLVKGWKDDPGLFEFLCARAVNDPDHVHEWGEPISRQIALETIIEQFLDHSQTLPLLRDRAENDKNLEVRCLAVQALVKGWKDDPKTLPLIKCLAQSDKSSKVRGVALRKLAQGWKDEPGMLEFLYDRAINDPLHFDPPYEQNLRPFVFSTIIEQYPDHPQTLSLLRDRAENDRDPEVQQQAVEVLAQDWKDEPGMFEFLCNLLVNGSFSFGVHPDFPYSYYPRPLVLRVIINQYSDHPQTLSFLQDRVENDPDEAVKEFAEEKLAELEKLPNSPGN